MFSLEFYIKACNPKVLSVKFDEKHLAVHVEVYNPKYASESYLTSEDVQKLLETYMWYANATHQDLIEWRSKLNE